ncbi:MAG: pilus assembly protein PilM [Sedimentisphaerales bacterium]
MADKKIEKPKRLGRGLASLFGPMSPEGAEAVLKSEPRTLIAETALQTPKTKSGLGVLSAETALQTPKTEGGLGVLSAKTMLQTLKTKSGLRTFSVKTALQMLKTKGLGRLRTKTALGIDISDKRISLVLLKKGNNGVELLASASAPVPDGAIKNGNIEDARVLAKVIKELKTRNKMRSSHTALSFIVDPEVIQILDLPKGVPANIGQFVRNEVKHYAKLPIKNIAVDFCGVESSVRLGNRRAFVVAADNQKITQAAKAMTSEGLSIGAFEPASVAYIRACYEKKIANKFDQNLLFAIVREGVLNLYLFRNQKLDFVRTKRFEADKADPDKYSKWLAAEIYEVMRFYEFEVLDKHDKWEVLLTTDIYSKYLKDNTKLLGTDGSALGIEAVELKVRSPEDEYLDTPFADTNLPDKPSAVAVGLAMKLLDLQGCTLNINLLPLQISEIKSARKQALVIANIAAVILFLMILSVGFFNTNVAKVTGDIERQTHLSRGIKELLNEQALLDKQIADVSGEFKGMNAVLKPTSFLKWEQILDEVRFAIPKKVWVTDISGDDGSKMLLYGQALSYDAVYLFVQKLNDSKHIVSASLIETKKDSQSKDLVLWSVSCSLIQ